MGRSVSPKEPMDFFCFLKKTKTVFLPSLERLGSIESHPRSGCPRLKLAEELRVGGAGRHRGRLGAHRAQRALGGLLRALRQAIDMGMGLGPKK